MQGDRLRAMTGLTHLRLSSHRWGTPATMSVATGGPPQQAELELQLVLSDRITSMRLLKSLEITGASLGALASAAAHLHVLTPALTDLRLANVVGGQGWDALWRALAGARSLRRLDNKYFTVELSSDFRRIGRLDQLRSLALQPYAYARGIVILQVSRLTGLTEV